MPDTINSGRAAVTVQFLATDYNAVIDSSLRIYFSRDAAFIFMDEGKNLCQPEKVTLLLPTALQRISVMPL